MKRNKVITDIGTEKLLGDIENIELNKESFTVYPVPMDIASRTDKPKRFNIGNYLYVVDLMNLDRIIITGLKITRYDMPDKMGDTVEAIIIKNGEALNLTVKLPYFNADPLHMIIKDYLYWTKRRK